MSAALGLDNACHDMFIYRFSVDQVGPSSRSFNAKALPRIQSDSSSIVGHDPQLKARYCYSTGPACCFLEEKRSDAATPVGVKYPNDELRGMPPSWNFCTHCTEKGHYFVIVQSKNNSAVARLLNAGYPTRHRLRGGGVFGWGIQHEVSFGRQLPLQGYEPVSVSGRRITERDRQDEA